MNERFVLKMEDKPYSVDSSDDINIEEEEDHIEDNPSKCSSLAYLYFEVKILKQ